MYPFYVTAYAAGEYGSPSNTITVTLPSEHPPKKVTVNLQPQVPVAGFIPYFGFYPPFGVVSPGYLVQIAVPQSSVIQGLSFVKYGHSSNEVGDPSAVVFVSAG